MSDAATVLTLREVLDGVQTSVDKVNATASKLTPTRTEEINNVINNEGKFLKIQTVYHSDSSTLRDTPEHREILSRSALRTCANMLNTHGVIADEKDPLLESLRDELPDLIRYYDRKEIKYFKEMYLNAQGELFGLRCCLKVHEIVRGSERASAVTFAVALFAAKYTIAPDQLVLVTSKSSPFKGSRSWVCLRTLPATLTDKHIVGIASMFKSRMELLEHSSGDSH